MGKNETLRNKMAIIGLTSAILLTLTGCDNIKEKVPFLNNKETEITEPAENPDQKYLDKIANLEKEVEELKSNENNVDSQTSYAINDKINYLIAQQMAFTHNIDFNDNILTNYVKTLAETSSKQTPDTIANNPKSIIAMVGYKDYGRSLALDYVMQEIVKQTASVKDEDRNNDELVGQLTEKYKNNSLVKNNKNTEQVKEIVLKLDAEDKVKEVLEMEMKSISDKLYETLLKEYNPTYYNALVKGEEIAVPDEKPEKDPEAYKKQIGYEEESVAQSKDNINSENIDNSVEEETKSKEKDNKAEEKDNKVGEKENKSKEKDVK